MRTLMTCGIIVGLLVFPKQADASTKSGVILPGAENLKLFSFSVIAGAGEVVVPQVVTMNWHVPGTVMITILSCRETGTTEAYDTKVSGFGEDHFLRLEVGLLTNRSCQVAIAWVNTGSTATSTQFYLGIEYGRPELVFDGATYAGLSSSEIVAGLDVEREMQRTINQYLNAGGL